MAIGLTHKFEDGVFYLAGVFDEHVNLAHYVNPAETAIRWNLRSVTAINSLGIRGLFRFLQDLGERNIEFYDAPIVFLDAANLVPMLTRSENRRERIRSIYLPMRCDVAHSFNASIPIKDISVQANSISLPIFDCPTCRMPLQVDTDTDIEDLLFFLME